MPDFDRGRFPAALVASAFLVLAACGGGGSGSDDVRPSKLFALDVAHSAVGSTANANPPPGTGLVPERIINGGDTKLSGGSGCDFRNCISSMALDSPRDQLYVSTRRGILVFNKAGTATGNVAPSRVINIGAGPRFIQLNVASDVLYISSGTIPSGAVDPTSSNLILALNSASTASDLSTASRTLTLTMGPNDTIIGFALDATHDVLYVAISRNTDVNVGLIRGVASKPSGALTLDAEFLVSATTNVADAIRESISVDPARDRLFVAIRPSQVLVFDNASTRTSGAQTPDRTIQLPGFPDQYRLFLESTNDRLYASSGHNQVLIVNNAGTATGTVAAPLILQLFPDSDFVAVVARP